MKIKYRF